MQKAMHLPYWRDLLRELVARDLKMRYQRSVLGLGWSMLKPLSQLLIFSFVFTTILPLGIPHYTSFVFTGVLVWSWLASVLGAAATSITGSPELIRKPGFPVFLLPVLTVLSNGVHFLLALPILLVFAFVDTGFAGAPLLALIPVMLLQALFMLSISYFIAASHVYFRDTQHFVGILIMLGFYVTPVFYSPLQSGHDYAFLAQFNPMAGILTAYRAILIDHAWPSAATFLSLLALSLPLLAAGVALFNHVSTRFAEEL